VGGEHPAAFRKSRFVPALGFLQLELDHSRTASTVNGWPAPLAAPPRSACGARLAVPTRPERTSSIRPFRCLCQSYEIATASNDKNAELRTAGDLHPRVTIITSLEQGVHPWTKPWSGENTSAGISRPPRQVALCRHLLLTNPRDSNANMRRLRALAHTAEVPLQIEPPQECRGGPNR
jgi:hypothetical protein